MKPRTLIVALALLLPAANALSAYDATPVEAVRLMRVEGHLELATDGSVNSAAVTTERVPVVLRDALLKLAKDWRFRPVMLQGKPSQVRVPFEIMLAARPNGDTFNVSIDGTNFGSREASAVVPDGMHANISGRSMKPPGYPIELMRERRGGAVLLAILISADGRAEKVEVERSLAHDFIRGSGDAVARRTMRVLEANAVRAAQQWTFNVPAAAQSLPPSQRTVLVPVIYAGVSDVDAPGYWVPVRRGPVRRASWLPGNADEALAFGAGGGGQPMGVDSPYRMLKPAAGQVLN